MAYEIGFTVEGGEIGAGDQILHDLRFLFLGPPFLINRLKLVKEIRDVFVLHVLKNLRGRPREPSN